MSPPLFDALSEVAERIHQAPRCLLCLDFDGTLAPFVPDPGDAFLSPAMDRLLRDLAGHDTLALAIVSGRDRADLQGRVKIPGVIYAGNHGLDISGPGFVYVEPTAASHSEELRGLSQALTSRLQSFGGVLVEYKGLTISVHYRQARESEGEEIRRVVHETLAGASHPFVLGAGDKVHEIRPRVYWNKGTAVSWIRTQLGAPDTLPIYVGDDTTDEDAFTAIRDDGIGIKVGAGAETAARYTVKDATEVLTFLQWLAELLSPAVRGQGSGVRDKES
jgi:trehalose 6-phosphate phosphatase